jgi:hypothetical protein
MRREAIVYPQHPRPPPPPLSVYLETAAVLIKKTTKDVTLSKRSVLIQALYTAKVKSEEWASPQYQQVHRPQQMMNLNFPNICFLDAHLHKPL